MNKIVIPSITMTTNRFDANWFQNLHGVCFYNLTSISLRNICIPLSRNSISSQLPIFSSQWYIRDHYRKKGTVPRYQTKMSWQEASKEESQCSTRAIQSKNTFFIQWTIVVPVWGYSSNILKYASIGSHLGRNSSSQKKSLTISGVASSKTVLLRYTTGPVW